MSVLTRPLPEQAGQARVRTRSRLPRERWRVISIRPNSEIGSSARARPVAGQLLLEPLEEHLAGASGSSMSMKSTTSSPPRSRSRIWRATSGTASRFVAKTVSSSPSLPTKRSGVDVDRDERLGLVDDDRAAGGKRDAALQRVLDLRSRRRSARRAARGRSRARGGARAAGRPRRGAPSSARSVASSSTRIVVAVVRQQVADAAQGEVELAVQQRGRATRSPCGRAMRAARSFR